VAKSERKENQELLSGRSSSESHRHCHTFMSPSSHFRQSGSFFGPIFITFTWSEERCRLTGSFTKGILGIESSANAQTTSLRIDATTWELALGRTWGASRLLPGKDSIGGKSYNKNRGYVNQNTKNF
jgi:hypothetical protein